MVDADGHISHDWFRANVWNRPYRGRAPPARHTHGLRHAHVSWQLAGGADLQIVKERLGHATITTTERYMHTLPGADEAALADIHRPRPATA